MKLYGTSSIRVVTSSIDSVTSAGGIFISASSIFMKNSEDEVYDLTDSKGYMQVTSYTSSGVYNYSRPGNIAYLQIVCVGAGGGGGAGARNVASAARGGGAAGGGGIIVQRWFPSGSLPSGIYTVTVGGGGSGGVTGSTAGTSAAGGNGSAGGVSSFTSGGITFLSAGGGSLGAGSTTAGVAASGRNSFSSATVSGSAIPGSSTIRIFRLGGIGGGEGGLSAAIRKTPNSDTSPAASNIAAAPPIYAFAGGRWGSNPATGSTSPFISGVNWQGGWYGMGGGGAGGHIDASNASVDGGTGSAAYIWSSFVAFGNAGGVGQNGDNGTDNIANGNFLISVSSSLFPTSSVGPGSPGHGGGPGNTAGTINGGAGGRGGNHGAGGGGGGGATNPAQAGNGGAGGTGCVLIFEYF